MCLFSYPAGLTLVLGAQKYTLIETVLLSTHSTCMITPEERPKGLQGIDILLVEYKYGDYFLTQWV